MIRLDVDAAKLTNECIGSYHSAHFMLSEHQGQCSQEYCPLVNMAGDLSCIEQLSNYGFRNYLDWPRGDACAVLFAANDGPDRLITDGHELFIIDCEQFFSARQSNIFADGMDWILPSWQRTAAAEEVQIEVCSKVAASIATSAEYLLRRVGGVDDVLYRHVSDSLCSGFRAAGSLLQRRKS